MSWEQIKALVGDNSEMLSFIDNQKTNSDANIITINGLEKSKGEILTELKSFKEGNTLIKNVLGIDKLNEETLKEALNGKGGKGDEKLTAEIGNLQKLLETANSEKSTLSSEYEGKIQKMALDNAISNSGVGATFANEAMYKLGINLIKDGASYEGDNIIFKNADGTTAYNGATPMSIQDKLNGLKADPLYSGLFKPDVSSGGGKNPQSSGNNTQTVISRSQLDGMDATSQSKFFADGGSLSD